MAAKPIPEHSDDIPQWDDLRRDSVGFVRDVLPMFAPRIPLAPWQQELLMRYDEGR